MQLAKALPTGPMLATAMAQPSLVESAQAVAEHSRALFLASVWERVSHSPIAEAGLHVKSSDRGSLRGVGA